MLPWAAAGAGGWGLAAGGWKASAAEVWGLAGADLAAED